MVRPFVRATLALILVSFSFVTIQAQSQPAAHRKTSAASATAVNIPIPHIKYTKFVLKNGLTVLVHEDHKAPIVAVNTWYHVGSKNEKLGKTGFAHLFEHLMFSGSQNFNYTYINAMERIGATNLNGTTNNDRTNYFENVPTSMLDYVLFAESDRMGHLLGVLDQKKLDLQRGVVQNEKRQDENQPYGVVDQLVTENTYPATHPYSWTVIGSMKDLDAASMSDVQDWFKTYYGPNNTTVVIAGDITPEVAREKVEKYYSDIPPGPPIAKQEVWIAKRTGTHRGWVQDRVPQARIYRVWNVPQYGSPEEAQLDLVARILGQGKTSRLYKRLVYKDQIATSATAFDDSNEIGGQFDFTLTAKPGADVKQMEREANEELQNFLKNGPTAEELQLAKTQILGNFARVVERIGGFGGKSDVLARCQTFTGNPDCYKTYLERVQAATTASVKKAANDWLSDGDYVLDVEPYPTTLKAAVDKLDRSHEPAPGAPVSLNLPAMESTKLSNGLKIVLAERHTAPVVNFSLLVDSGYAADPASAPGTASFAQRMLEEGTPTRDSLKIGEELESLSANFNAGANLDWGFVNLNTLKSTMDKALDIYSDLILHPSFPEKEFVRLQKERLAAIQREKVTPVAMALRVSPVLLYGKGHPYGVPFTGSGTEASVSKMTRADLAKFHDTWFKPNNSTLLIVGDTTLAEITPKLEKLFAAWKTGDVPKKNIATVQQPGKDVVYLIDRPGSGQSIITAAQLAPPRNDPDAIPLELVNDIFGGTFSSRINMNLREDKHYSYGVFSIIPAALGQRPYLSISPVQTDKTKESLEQLVDEYHGITSSKPISEKELQDEQTNATLGLSGRFETVQQLSGAYSTILEYNLPHDYFNTFTKAALAVTPDSANSIARKFILPDHLIWVIVGDMSKVEAGIRSLNLGEVHKIDADGNPVQ
jgi:zinc protease